MMKTKVFEGGFCNLHPSDCNPFATATRHYLNIASWTRGGMEDKIVDFIFDSMRRSISFMDGIQKQNEKAVRVMLDYGIAARERAIATGETVSKLAIQQAETAQKAAADYEETVKKAVKESGEAVNAAMEKATAAVTPQTAKK